MLYKPLRILHRAHLAAILTQTTATEMLIKVYLDLEKIRYPWRRVFFRESTEIHSRRGASISCSNCSGPGAVKSLDKECTVNYTHNIEILH